MYSGHAQRYKKLLSSDDKILGDNNRIYKLSSLAKKSSHRQKVETQFYHKEDTMEEAMDETNSGDISAEEREKMLKKLKNRLKEGDNIFIGQCNGEGSTGQYIHYDAETKIVTRYFRESFNLTAEEEKAKDEAWNEWDRVSDMRCDLMDKISEADCELEVFFQRGNQRKYDELEEEENRLYEEYGRLLAKKSKITTEGIVTLEEIQMYFDAIAEITLSYKNERNEVMDWLNA